MFLTSNEVPISYAGEYFTEIRFKTKQFLFWAVRLVLRFVY